MYSQIRAHASAWAIGIALGIFLPTTSCFAETLTLREALARARDANPTLAAAAARTEAAQAERDQAGRRPNPFLSMTGENLAGSRTSFGNAETTLSYNQPFERGGKRAARVSVANAEIDAAKLRETISLLDLYQAVETAWVETAAAEAEAVLAAERLAIAQRLRQDTNRRVAAARDPAFAGARVDTLATQAQIAHDQAEAAVKIARAALASYWQGQTDFDLDKGALDVSPDLTARPDQPVDIALLDAERQVSSARVTLEQARAVQDPTLQLGMRHLNSNNEVALVAGVSFPLAFFNTNTANIARARAEGRAAEQDVAAAKIAWERAFFQLRARLDAHATEARRLESDTIPGADKTLRLVRDTFDRGAFSYLEVTEAEKALADARARRIEVLKLYHLDMARLKRLLGSHIAETPMKETR
jgi:cobalt-zinc-cadmium efflux system outer membrane protein